MFLAPLNFDRFFKKVFSNLLISKRFLEDFLEVRIETIELLERKHTVTDSSATIEFDFRCKIDGQYTVVDMQQWYKADVIKRFYLYNAVNCTLQLETLPKRDFPEIEGKKFDTKSYKHLLPTITLIWMSDDNLGFEEDFISYVLYPEQTVEFLKNDELWTSDDRKKIDIARQNVLTLLNNKTKNLDFLAKNRMIFAFQKNIVKNKKLKKYVRWFEFAEKTRNKNNVEADFEAYKNDDTLMEVMERLQTNKFVYEELSALEALERELALSAVWKMGVEEELREELIEELTPQIKQELTPQIKQELTPQIKQELTPKIKQEARNERDIETVVAAYQQKLPLDLIMNITLLPLEKINQIIEKYKLENNIK